MREGAGGTSITGGLWAHGETEILVILVIDEQSEKNVRPHAPQCGIFVSKQQESELSRGEATAMLISNQSASHHTL